MNKRFVGRLLCLLAGLVVGLPVQADTWYDTQAGFLAALPSGANAVVETFDGIGDFPPTPLVLSGFGAATSSPAGLYSILDSGSDRWLSINLAMDSILITFSTPVLAAGGFFFPTDVIGDPISGTIRVIFFSSEGGTVRDLVDAGPTTFLGYIPSVGGFTGLTIQALQDISVVDGVFPAVNDLTFAAVPEPGSAVLMAVGMLLVGGSAGRKKRLHD